MSSQSSRCIVPLSTQVRNFKPNNDGAVLIKIAHSVHRIKHWGGKS